MRSCLVIHHIFELCYAMLSCLDRHHICEIMSRYPFQLNNIHVHYFMPSFFHTIYCICLSYNVCTFNYVSCSQPFELERVMPVSSGIKTRSSNKIVLPLGGDSTPVVHAREPALPHITQTLADCTPTVMDREPASPNLTPTPQIVTQFLLTQHQLHHRAP